ncbi:Heptaprenyl diphosphate synthase component I [Thioalkalivibrio nitratireducens DSM 14787]|uniref:Heptaprenyl diphosphate synthase component I n=1 Tax=Thioalkalivibrio nitratireducens (strain DSM 14787 / UNIQEM 213 / ALEN2) TaxID=1255043 RepID=L0DR12_THIND|nr:Gx transporter family protein [Thioalkalivibrio nitratireducens]AGA32019.1 Heptaprenyl diphosphate synthase component I [Thioalkalivibrio nitratireducens DSM 14787]
MTGTPDVSDHRIAALAALAIGLQIIEAAIPSPVPGIKPGLANVVTLVALLALGWRAALAVTLVRIVGASLLLGTLLGPAFWLSLTGGLTALGVLVLLAPLHPRRLSALGLAIPAAMAHTLGQFLLAWAVIVPHPKLPLLLPPLLLAALITGLITGILTVSVLADPRIQRHVRLPLPIRAR